MSMLTSRRPPSKHLLRRTLSELILVMQSCSTHPFPDLCALRALCSKDLCFSLISARAHMHLVAATNPQRDQWLRGLHQLIVSAGKQVCAASRPPLQLG